MVALRDVRREALAAELDGVDAEVYEDRAAVVVLDDERVRVQLDDRARDGRDGLAAQRVVRLDREAGAPDDLAPCDRAQIVAGLLGA